MCVCGGGGGGGFWSLRDILGVRIYVWFSVTECYKEVYVCVGGGGVWSLRDILGVRIYVWFSVTECYKEVGGCLILTTKKQKPQKRLRNNITYTASLCLCEWPSARYRGEDSLWEWPIPTQLLVWGTLFAARCDEWSGWWVESWLIPATEYIAIDNAPLRPEVHVDGRSGFARPDLSAGHAKLKS